MNALVRTVAIAALIGAAFASPLEQAFALSLASATPSVPLDGNASIASTPVLSLTATATMLATVTPGFETSAASSAVTATSLPSRLPNPTPNKVPNVVGIPQAKAIAQLKASGYVIKVAAGRYDSRVKRDSVSVENPRAGSELRRGRTVTLTPSLGTLTFKRAKVSVYGGPGEAQGTAGSYKGCGSTRSLEAHGILYFAHKSMPFGTKVLFRYNGHTAIAVCVDRGPYVRGRTFDLGVNTAKALHLSGVETVDWAIVK